MSGLKWERKGDWGENTIQIVVITQVLHAHGKGLNRLLLRLLLFCAIPTPQDDNPHALQFFQLLLLGSNLLVIHSLQQVQLSVLRVNPSNNPYLLCLPLLQRLSLHLLLLVGDQQLDGAHSLQQRVQSRPTSSRALPFATGTTRRSQPDPRKRPSAATSTANPTTHAPPRSQPPPASFPREV